MATEIMKRPAGELAPIPAHIETEDREVAMRDENLARMALLDPEATERRLVAREKTLATLRTVAIKASHPYDWTLYQDKEGRIVGVPRDSAAVQIRKWMGISIFNYRPLSLKGFPEPQISEEDGENGAVVTIVEMWADGLCSLTGEQVEGVYYAVRSDKPFTGSGTLQDLKASCRTGLDAKVTRILSGLRKVPADTLTAMGIDITKCHAGMGYGSSAARQAGKVAEEGVAEKAAKLREEILRRVGGDTATAKQLCRDITKGDKPGKDGKVFPGFDTPDRLTQSWQIDAALTKLKNHPVFGDAAAAQGREPGAEG